ncbi:fungal-specific transcription factor domain-containing protein [Dactylonectria estremocensis]|uniref:Fungal-specific transcription factor domain-containing protein n=1 Tax=Dactylonectria estremocensis TaxID=1079267 RepID=A0A9P9DA56_9HYPO|nr:fungal-specific transcription factor domain-containing protein [Dactylonectria estremocensis]
MTSRMAFFFQQTGDLPQSGSCTDASMNPQSRGMPPLTLTKAARPRLPRFKTGCLCCRLRKKKCPEEKPICTSCKKLGLPCSWPQSDEFAWRLNMGIEGHTPARDAIKCLSEVSSRINKTCKSDASTIPRSLSPPSACLQSTSTSSSASSPPWSLSDFILGPWDEAVEIPPPCTPPKAAEISTNLATLSKTSPPRRSTKRASRKKHPDVPNPPFLATICGTWAALDSTSQDVLRYYVEYTSDRMMSQKPGATNVWKSTVLQLAESDELVMNAVLAVGSVHWAASLSSNQAIEEATTRYVLHSITGLQLALKDWIGGSSAMSDDTLRLMLVTCLLAEHECLGGNFNGTLQLHLRAIYPVARALESKHTNSRMELVAHLLEHTAYLQFLSVLRFPRPGDKSGNDSIDLVRLIHEGRFTLLKSYETFGAYFGCAAELYEMIPTLHKFYSTRDLEISTGRDLGCAVEFKRLLYDISSWQPPQDPYETQYKYTDTWLNGLGGYEGPEERAVREETERARKSDESPMVASAFAIQNSLLLFLYSAYLRHREDQSRLVVATQPIVDETLDIIDRIKRTTWENTTWWPTIVVGSYARSPEQQKRLLASLEEFSPPMGIVTRGMELLKEVWNSPDDIFGLDGLSKAVGASEAYCFG